MELNQVEILVKLVSIYGIPSVFMIAVLLILMKVVLWLRPQAENLIENHLKLMKTMRISLRKLVNAVETNSATMVEVKQNSKMMTQMLEQSHRLLEEHHQLALKVAHAMKIPHPEILGETKDDKPSSR